MRHVEYEFCMKQFKPAIAGLAILVVLVLAWTGWHCTARTDSNADLLFAATTTPLGPPISVKDKMLHPYWGNCNKCHVTVDAGKPISKVMAGVPISIKDKMPHKYWGNCLLCHQVVDGFQPKKKQQAIAARANRLTARTLGLKLQPVTATMMQKLGLANEDGVLVVDLAANSIAAQAGLRRGDEIVRMGKTRIETINDFQSALNNVKPGSKVKISIFRGNKKRNLFVMLPQSCDGGPLAAAAKIPMTQNRVETFAEQIGVPETRQEVGHALERQGQARAAANLNFGKVAVGAMGPGPGSQVSHQFGASPYFVIFDPSRNSYKVVANPNANDATERGIQTGQYVVDLGVNNVIAGSFNQNALNTLRTLRVNVYSGVTGSVQSALSGYAEGQLVPVNTHLHAQAGLPGGYVPIARTKSMYTNQDPQSGYYPQSPGTQQVQTIY